MTPIQVPVEDDEAWNRPASFNVNRFYLPHNDVLVRCKKKEKEIALQANSNENLFEMLPKLLGLPKLN